MLLHISRLGISMFVYCIFFQALLDLYHLCLMSWNWNYHFGHPLDNIVYSDFNSMRVLNLAFRVISWNWSWHWSLKQEQYSLLPKWLPEFHKALDFFTYATDCFFFDLYLYYFSIFFTNECKLCFAYTSLAHIVYFCFILPYNPPSVRAPYKHETKMTKYLLPSIASMKHQNNSHVV